MPKTARLLAMVAKERRQRVQDELRQRYHSTTVNITAKSLGSVKYHDDTVSLVYYAKDMLRRHIQKAQYCLFEERVYHFPAGPWAIMAIDGDANFLKDICISIEEEGNCGRLIDIDVFDHQGRQICRFSRGFQERHCIICQQCAIECMRTHNHPQHEAIAATKTLMIEYWAKRTNNWPEPVEVIGTTALEAMLMEVACAPAPGLVDRFNSGAHNDMDFFTFIKSSSALAPAMYRCALAGWEHRGEADELLLVLRSIGQEAEDAMFRATDGINTQKGLLFLMGVTAAAAARVLRWQVVRNTFTETVLEETSAICKGIVERELGVLRHRKPLRRLTSGEEFYLSHGIRGIRGEVEDGLPSVKTKGLPFFRDALGTGCSLNDALVHALIGLMSEVEDTTILCRHGIDTLTKVQAEAKSIVENGGMLSITGCQRIESLDARFSHLRISPGGSADLLAVTYFLDCIEERFGVSCQ